MLAGEPIAARATGTDRCVAVQASAGNPQQFLQQSVIGTTLGCATECDDSGHSILSASHCNALQFAEFGDRKQRGASESDSFADRRETSDEQIYYRAGSLVR